LRFLSALVASEKVLGKEISFCLDEDVLVVDSNLTPASARGVLAEIRKLTNKPVRYVVNSHQHSDHIYGNQVYQDAFPQVDFIAQSNMREAFLKEIPQGLKDFIDSSRKTITEGTESLATGKKKMGEALTEKEKKSLASEIELLKKYLPEFEKIRPVAPTLTVEKELTLHRGNRLIKFLYFGRGNTRGDLITYLPKEKILITGDLLVHPIPFAFESYLGDWVQTLKKMRELDADVIIPGHGPVMRNKDYLDLVTNLLETIVTQTHDSVKRGLSLEEIKKTINLEAFRVKIAGEDTNLNFIFTQVFVPTAVERAYKEAKGEIERP